MNKTSNNKFSKAKDTLLVASPFLCFGILLAGMILVPKWEERDFYTPGQTLNRKERAVVNNVQDSTLNARVAQYNEMRADYLAQRGWKTRDQKRSINMRTLRQPHKMYDYNYGNMVGDYRKFLCDYERDSIEARYHELAVQLARQTAKQR